MAWEPLFARLPVLHWADLLSSVSTAAVVAPHPDDETLGAGGLIAALSAAGVDTSVVVCTDGSAAALSPPIRPRRLAALRAREVHDAVQLLSGRRIEPLLLGLPDGQTTDSVSDLVTLLRPSLKDADLVIGPWSGDGHPDHEACSLAVRSAGPRNATLLEYPIWAWHWDNPTDPVLRNLVQVPLPHGARRLKLSALRCHRSQIAGERPILSEHVLEHFSRTSEAFVVRAWGGLRRVDRSSSGFLEAMYRADPERDPWGFAAVTPEKQRLDHLAELVRDLGGGRWTLELGCGNGQLTRRLIPQCDRIVAVDASAAAIEAATDAAGDTKVEWRVARLPDGLRDGDDEPFDLIIMSEIGYYFEPVALEALVLRLTVCAAAGANLVLCHWTGSSADHRLSAGDVHAVSGRVLRARRWKRIDDHQFGDHLVEVWVRCR